MSSKKILTVEWEDEEENEYDGSGYMSDSPQYVFARRKNESTIIVPDNCSVGTCREGFLSDLREYIDYVPKLNIICASFAMMNDFNNSRFEKKAVDAARNRFRINAENGLKIARAFEKKLGWTPETRVFHAANEGSDFDYHPIYFIEGPRAWIKAPYFMSLYTLLFRIGGLSTFTKGLEKATGVNQILEVLKSSSKSSKRSDDIYDDVGRVRRHFDKWFKILDNYDKLFEKKKFKSAYLTEDDVNGSEIGIDSLVEAETPSGKLNQQIREILG